VPAGGESEREILRLAAAVEVGSEHPLGAAIVAHARELGIEFPAASLFGSLTGMGVRGTVEERAI
jgi:cation transport ATPase